MPTVAPPALLPAIVVVTADAGLLAGLGRRAGLLGCEVRVAGSEGAAAGPAPYAVVVDLAAGGAAVRALWASLARPDRPPVVAVAAGRDGLGMRAALDAGADAVLPPAATADEVFARIREVVRHRE